jgi:hypothetical protein
MAAAKIVMSAEYRSMSHVRPESFVQTTGGSMEYSPKTVTMTDLSGRTLVRDNLPIPLPFGRTNVFPNVQVVASLCSQIVRNTSGTWESSISTVAWQKTFRSVINVPGMQMVAKATTTILSRSSSWQAMETIQRNTIQGPELLSFVVSALNQLDPVVYWTLNTMIVFDGLRAFEKRGNEYLHCVDENGNRVIPAECYTFIDFPDNKAITSSYPAIAQYNGKLPLELSFPEADGSFESARLAQSRLREVQGSDSSCASLLAAMRGYSGLTDVFGRRVTFLVSATLFCWMKKRSVDIQLSTVGDLSMLISSLNYWRRKIISTPRDSDVQKMFSDGVYECDVRFIVPKASDFRSVPATLHNKLNYYVRADSVYVGFHDVTLPTSDKKGQKVDYDAFSKTLVPGNVGSSDYLIYSAIFGDFPFLSDQEVIRTRNSTLKAVMDVKYKMPYVFRFGIASGFGGVLSSFADCHLLGFGWEPKERAKDGSQLFDATSKVLHVIRLPLVSSQRRWHEIIVEDCAIQVTIFFNPVIRYSGISNLVRQSKEAAVMQLRIVPMESGISLPLEVSRTEIVKREVVDFSPKISSSSTTSTLSPSLIPSFLPLPPPASSSSSSSSTNRVDFSVKNDLLSEVPVKIKNEPSDKFEMSKEDDGSDDDNVRKDGNLKITPGDVTADDM